MSFSTTGQARFARSVAQQSGSTSTPRAVSKEETSKPKSRPPAPVNRLTVRSFLMSNLRVVNLFHASAIDGIDDVHHPGRDEPAPDGCPRCRVLADGEVD